MNVKHISRKDWQRILRSEVVFCEKRLPKMHFMSSLYRIHEVIAPLHVKACRQSFCAADAGYAWLHVLPEGENWCLTAMYDKDGAPVQYYFDITQDNVLDGEGSRFTDLYLDIVCLPDGRMEIIDQDDLEQALTDGEITREQYELAERTATELQKQIAEDFDRLTAFCCALHDELRA